MSASRADYDVIVVGGGPAGACTAALVAEAGHRTLLLERSTEPHFKIGESLMPATYWTLDRLGVLDEMKASGFQRKSSVQFFNAAGKPSQPFYFFESDPHESSHTWQVDRSKFDQMLLENAAAKGTEVVRGANVRRVLFDGERAVGVRLTDADGEARELGSRVVVDATGQSRMLGRRLKLRKGYPCLENASYYAHFRGAYRDADIDEGATLVLQTSNQRGWFWYIPLSDDRVSVGVVATVGYFKENRPADPEAVFAEEVVNCPEIERRIEGAEQIRPVTVAKDFSYRSTQIAGDGWLLVGDAFGFLDPIYSSGVFLALKSGEMAADSIRAALAADDTSGAKLGEFGPRYLAGMEAIRKLVYAFYNRDFSFARFLKAHPDLLEPVVDLLVGNVFRKPVDHLFGPLGETCWLPEEETFEPELALGAE